ncbi:hypothetical protein [Paenibacillus sp. GYB003]|uniref:hypothetical protein n=1 Tax=Paenibacillus sp. GYB003 TaxID=2994392 RepID=UPI002F965B28
MAFKRIKQETIEKAREVDILFIAQAMGEELTKSGRSYFTYQNQSESTPSVAITPSKGIWKNFGGTEGGRDAISYFAYRTYNSCSPSGTEFIEAVKAVCQMAGIPIEYEDGSIEEATTQVNPNREVFRGKKDDDECLPKEKPERIDFVYREWMKHLPLTEAHVKHFSETRKISASAMKIREYRSFLDSKADRYKAVKEMMRVTHEPAGVPGFALCQGKYGPYWTTLGRAGILIPFRDIDNRISGFQIRADEPPKIIKRQGRIRINEPSYNVLQAVCPDTGAILWEGNREQLPIELPEGKVWMEDGGIYSWFASLTYKKKGIIAGTLLGDPSPYHCAVPSRILSKWRPGVRINEVMDTRTIWWGEGPLKGDIASDFTDEIHLQAAGVNSWRVLLEPTLTIAPERVILGFDADAHTKQGVRDNVLNCIREAQKNLSARGIELLIAIWPYHVGKGLDDTLNAGYKAQIITIPKEVRSKN